MQLQIEDLVFTFDGIQYETFDELPDYYGVVFLTGDGFRYEVIVSKLGVRLLINHKTQYGFGRDVPFHEGTFHMLPEGVHVERKPCSSTG